MAQPQIGTAKERFVNFCRSFPDGTTNKDLSGESKTEYERLLSEYIEEDPAGATIAFLTYNRKAAIDIVLWNERRNLEENVRKELEKINPGMQIPDSVVKANVDRVLSDDCGNKAEEK